MVDVGELDPLVDESSKYADRLRRSGISVELHVFPGCPLAFDGMLPNSTWAGTANTSLVRAMKSIKGFEYSFQYF